MAYSLPGNDYSDDGPRGASKAAHVPALFTTASFRGTPTPPRGTVHGMAKPVADDHVHTHSTAAWTTSEIAALGLCDRMDSVHSLMAGDISAPSFVAAKTSRDAPGGMRPTFPSLDGGGKGRAAPGAAGHGAAATAPGGAGHGSMVMFMGPPTVAANGLNSTGNSVAGLRVMSFSERGDNSSVRGGHAYASVEAHPQPRMPSGLAKSASVIIRSTSAARRVYEAAAMNLGGSAGSAVERSGSRSMGSGTASRVLLRSNLNDGAHGMLPAIDVGVEGGKRSALAGGASAVIARQQAGMGAGAGAAAQLPATAQPAASTPAIGTIVAKAGKPAGAAPAPGGGALSGGVPATAAGAKVQNAATAARAAAAAAVSAATGWVRSHAGSPAGLNIPPGPPSSTASAPAALGAPVAGSGPSMAAMPMPTPSVTAGMASPSRGGLPMMTGMTQGMPSPGRLALLQAGGSDTPMRPQASVIAVGKMVGSRAVLSPYGM